MDTAPATTPSQTSEQIGIVRQFRDAIAFESHHALVLRLTLLLVVLHGTTSAFATVAVRVVVLLMLVIPMLTTKGGAWWWFVAASLVASNADQWEMIDNHQYLITYWVLACALSLKYSDALRLNARLLVAVAFTFAVIWKILANEYLDGSFFYVTFMTDGRLQTFAGMFAGEGVQSVRAAGDAIYQLGQFGSDGSRLAVYHDARLHTVARTMSWAALLVESAVAICHLLPGNRWYLARHVALMSFVAFTYLLLPVVGFGFLLGVLGFAQTREDDIRTKQGYILLLCFLQVSLVPWRNLLAP